MSKRKMIKLFIILHHLMKLLW